MIFSGGGKSFQYLKHNKTVIRWEKKWMGNIKLAIKGFKTALLQINRIKATEIFDNLYENDEDFYQLETIAMGALKEIGEGWENGTILFTPA